MKSKARYFTIVEFVINEGGHFLYLGGYRVKKVVKSFRERYLWEPEDKSKNLYYDLWLIKLNEYETFEEARKNAYRDYKRFMDNQEWRNYFHDAELLGTWHDGLTINREFYWSKKLFNGFKRR